MITIKEIADIADVSRGTVDRVINNRGGVDKKTEEKIRKIIDTSGYIPNAAGRNLALKKKKLKFGFILVSDKHSYTRISNSVQDYAKNLAEYGIEVITKDCPSTDYHLQIQVIRELYESGVSGIVLSPVCHEDVSETIREYTEKGICFVTYYNDLPDSHRLTFIGCDYYRCGRAVGNTIGLILQGSGTVGIINNDSVFSMNPSKRLRGLNDKLQENYPGIEIAASVFVHDDDISSYSATKQMLSDHPEISCVFLNDAGLLGACRAIEECNRPLKVIFTGWFPAAYEYFEKGILDVMINEQRIDQGKLPLELLYQHIAMGNPSDQEYRYTDIEIVVEETMMFH